MSRSGNAGLTLFAAGGVAAMSPESKGDGPPTGCSAEVEGRLRWPGVFMSEWNKAHDSLHGVVSWTWPAVSMYALIPICTSHGGKVQVIDSAFESSSSDRSVSRGRRENRRVAWCSVGYRLLAVADAGPLHYGAVLDKLYGSACGSISCGSLRKTKIVTTRLRFHQVGWEVLSPNIISAAIQMHVAIQRALVMHILSSC